MNDDPFAAFKEGEPPVEDKPKNGRKKRKIPPKKTAEAAPTADPSAAKKPRKARAPRQTKEMRLPISMLLEIGSLSAEESGALLSIGAGLQKLPKKSRQKISAALGKIFG